MEHELEKLRAEGFIGDFKISTLDDGLYLTITAGENAPHDLREFVADRLSDMIPRDRISIQDSEELGKST